jgi:plastocyanin
LSYQWYSNTTNSNTGGTVINNATSTSYTIPTNLNAGTYYYFCEVRATGATSVRSNVGTVAVNTPATPVITITTHPAANTTVTQGSITGSLSVAATVNPSATLSYQWYSNTTNSNTGGTVISGATSASYTIPTNLNAGTYYYFCELLAAGATSVRSNVATVTVNAPIGIDNLLFSDVAIYPNPCTTFVIIKNAAGADLKIINMLGETIEQRNNLSDLHQISMDNLSTGIYMFQLIQEGKVKTVKVVKSEP